MISWLNFVPQSDATVTGCASPVCLLVFFVFADGRESLSLPLAKAHTTEPYFAGSFRAGSGIRQLLSGARHVTTLQVLCMCC